MAAPFVPIATVAGFGLFVVAVTRLNEGRSVDIGGIFPAQGRNDWPHGVQERDLPRFATDHAATHRQADVEGDGAGLPWIEELIAPHSPMPSIERIVARAPRLAARH